MTTTTQPTILSALQDFADAPGIGAWARGLDEAQKRAISASIGLPVLTSDSHNSDIARLERQLATVKSALAERDRDNVALRAHSHEWNTRTQWVQDGFPGNGGRPGEHRADFLTRRVAELAAERDAALAELADCRATCDATAARCVRLRNALTDLVTAHDNEGSPQWLPLRRANAVLEAAK